MAEDFRGKAYAPKAVPAVDQVSDCVSVVQEMRVSAITQVDMHVPSIACIFPHLAVEIPMFPKHCRTDGYRGGPEMWVILRGTPWRMLTPKARARRWGRPRMCEPPSPNARCTGMLRQRVVKITDGLCLESARGVALRMRERT